MRMKSIVITAIMLSTVLSVTGEAKEQSYFVPSKESLREIAFPLGGIGASNINIEGRGALRDWEIYNHPNKGTFLPMTCPVIWPKALTTDFGSRPKFPFVYSDEVCTGIEYQVASHLIYEGMVDEGLKIVKAVRKRYMPAMSSWGLVLSLSGFHYDAVDKTLYLDSKWGLDKNMNCFFSTNSAWGVFEYKSGNLKLMPIEGEFIVNRVVTDSGNFEIQPAQSKVSFVKPLIAKMK